MAKREGCVRFGFVRVFQQTNSFANSLTETEQFRAREWNVGETALTPANNQASVYGGAVRAADELGAAVVPLLLISARTGGPISDAALAEILDEIKHALVQHGEFDGLLLEVSGALLTTLAHSADEILLETITSEIPNVPIAVVMSSQANVTERIVELAQGIIAPYRVPNSDASGEGERAARLLTRICQGGNSTSRAFMPVPLLIPVAAQRSDREPMGEILDCARKHYLEDGSIEVSVFCGYPWADAEHAGCSVVVTSQNNQDAADEIARDLSAMIWKRREDFFVPASNVEEAVHYAMASKTGPILITDMGDNPDDGAPGDGTTILWALLDLGVRNATIAAIADEQAVEASVRAGVDARVEIPVGGRRDTRHGYPIDIRAKVVAIHHDVPALAPSTGHDVSVDPGRTVVLDVEARHEGHVELVLTENPVQITSPAFFDQLGIDLAERSIVSIKSISDYRPAFERVAEEIFEVITPGITTPDPAFFAYQRVRRPIFPLDAME
jgi:microcystin degradation protein MlrC